MKKSLFVTLIVVAMMAMAFSTMAVFAQDGPEVCAADPAGCAVIPAGDTIKIGMGAPMLGDYSMFGIDISQGVEYALVTDDGYEGWSYELVAEDTGGSPEMGAAVANKFVTESDMVAIAGHIFSGSTEAAMPIYEEAMYPMMSPSATLPSLTESGSAVFNRLCFTDAIQAKFAAMMLANDLGVTKLAVLHDGSSYGKGLADEVKAQFEAETGMEAVAYEAVTPGESDYSAVLAAVAAAGPEAVYFGGYSAEGIVMANQWAQAGLSGVTFFGADGVYGTEFLEKTGPNGEGAIAVSLVPPTTAEKEAFDAGYEEMYGMAAGSLSAFTWSSYDVGSVIVAAIEKVAVVDGDTLYVPRTAVTEAMRATSYEGLTGLIQCDETGECNASGPTFYVVSGGEWVPWTADAE
jgi:branched-chain amino acid transport system substrate-binding protein